MARPRRPALKLGAYSNARLPSPSYHCSIQSLKSHHAMRDNLNSRRSASDYCRVARFFCSCRVARFFCSCLRNPSHQLQLGPHYDESINNIRLHQTAVDQQQIQDLSCVLFLVLGKPCSSYTSATFLHVKCNGFLPGSRRNSSKTVAHWRASMLGHLENGSLSCPTNSIIPAGIAPPKVKAIAWLRTVQFIVVHGVEHIWKRLQSAFCIGVERADHSIKTPHVPSFFTTRCHNGDEHNSQLLHQFCQHGQTDFYSTIPHRRGMTDWRQQGPVQRAFSPVGILG
ncbi:hypothetical protein LMH87_006545 [Akanthomyces muscarius]|uniref:Uncharacterized protein n=1 Tax=Akanthomyces muscarius TaxID=2231603 RepID=A0A9W8URL0_AKAMU|nr:hypothetical protein LMH87_006545 [Akanthomyces muscarius]KAJ4164891.1 hypothetical protein LMH87_006545 [Akanthomyces muscarius]